MKTTRAGTMIGVTLVAIAGLAGVAEAQAPAPSANRGKILFLQCVACHDLKPGIALPPAAPGAPTLPPKVGPHLGDIIGRKAGTVPALTLSPQLKASNVVWTEDMLDKWIEKPSNVVPGTVMAFVGVAKPEDRQRSSPNSKRQTGAGGRAR